MVVERDVDGALRAISDDEVRAGETGHHVRYVLGAGLLGAILAFVSIGVYFGFERLSGAVSQALSQDPIEAMKVAGPYALFVVLGSIAGMLLLRLWSVLLGGSDNATQAGMRLRVVAQLVVVSVIMAMVWYSAG